MKDTKLDMAKFQATETQLENYIETLRSTVAMLDNRIGELQETLSQVRGKITQLKSDDIPIVDYPKFDNISNFTRH